MKTSSKMLFGLLAVIIISIFAVNIVLKIQIDKRIEVQKASVIQNNVNVSDSTVNK